MRTPLPMANPGSPFYIPAYMGPISREEAESKLMQTMTAGLYLIRWSNKSKFYCVSFVDNMGYQINHMGEIYMETGTLKIHSKSRQGVQMKNNSMAEFIQSQIKLGEFLKPYQNVSENEYLVQQPAKPSFELPKFIPPKSTIPKKIEKPVLTKKNF